MAGDSHSTTSAWSGMLSRIRSVGPPPCASLGADTDEESGRVLGELDEIESEEVGEYMDTKSDESEDRASSSPIFVYFFMFFYVFLFFIF